MPRCLYGWGAWRRVGAKELLKGAGKSMVQPPGKILAAGGILLGKGPHEGRIAIIRRPRYRGEISLPKGKIKKGETEVTAALREVREETGFGAKIKEYAGSTHYIVGDLPKVVSYFLMEAEDEEAVGPREGGRGRGRSG